LNLVRLNVTGYRVIIIVPVLMSIGMLGTLVPRKKRDKWMSFVSGYVS